MSTDAYGAATNDMDGDNRHKQDVTLSDTGGREERVLSPEEYRILDAIQRRVLWLCTKMIHHANHVRSNTDELKVGGHQASSASMVSILTALYFHYLDAGDRVSIKPHASPAYLGREVALLQADGFSAQFLDREQTQALIKTPLASNIAGGRFLPEQGRWAAPPICIPMSIGFYSYPVHTSWVGLPVMACPLGCASGNYWHRQ